ncbi:MAG: acyltransferase [Nitrospirae bacterium]|nr:acyltransferase [Nitrospirota bacterium]
MLATLRQKLLRYIIRDVNCVKGSNTVVHASAHIINTLNKKENISIGNWCHIKGELLLFGHGGKIIMGDYCYVGENTRIWSAKEIRIGNRVLISHNCNIFDNDTHPLDPGERHMQFKQIISTGHPKKIDLKEKAVLIKDDVLIGASSIILKGVTLGEASVVAAGSVVTRDVPPYVVVAGNPARVIKKINV